MLILFFVIVFAAELIITLELIYRIKKADAKVISANAGLTECIPEIRKGFINIHIGLNKILLGLNKIEQKIITNKEKYKIIITKNIISWALLIALNMSGKKISSFVDLIFAIKDLTRSVK